MEAKRRSSRNRASHSEKKHRQDLFQGLTRLTKPICALAGAVYILFLRGLFLLSSTDSRASGMTIRMP